MATMFPGVRPSISFASLPTASTSPVFLLMATMEGSFTTMPLPLAYTSVLAVPRSIARSLENMLKSERRLWMREFSDLKPLDDIPALSIFVIKFGKTRAGFRHKQNLQTPHAFSLNPVFQNHLL